MLLLPNSWSVLVWKLIHSSEEDWEYIVVLLQVIWILEKWLRLNVRLTTPYLLLQWVFARMNAMSLEMKKQESLRELRLFLNFSWFQLTRKENKSRREEHKLSSLCNCWLVTLDFQAESSPRQDPQLWEVSQLAPSVQVQLVVVWP